MKIIKEDQNIMVLKDRNSIAFIVGILFLFVGIAAVVKPDFFTSQPSFWSGLAGIILGGFVVAVAKITTVHLDKSAGKITFVRKGFIGRSIKEYDLRQMKEVELSVAYHTSDKGGGHSYHLAFVFNNGDIVQLNPGHSSIMRVMGRQIIPEKNLGARIAAFLGVPFQERRPPTVTETLSAVTSAIQNAAEKEVEKQKQS
jgi:hypothetical protein